MATTIQPVKPIKQGELSQDGTGINNFNPLDGSRLSPGQTVSVPQVDTRIPATTIGTIPLVVRPQVTPASGEAFNQYITTKTKLTDEISLEDQQKQDIANLQKEKDTYKKDFSNLFKEQAGLAQERENIFQQEGGDIARKEARELSNQIVAEQDALRVKVEALKKNPRGLYGGGLEQEINRLQDETSSRLASLSIRQAASQGRYTDAAEIADRFVEMKSQDLRTKLEQTKLFYEDNKDSLDKNLDRRYQESIKKQERELEKKETELNDIKQIKLLAARNGASMPVLNSLSKAETLDEALSTPGLTQYFMTQSERANLANRVSQVRATGTIPTGSTGTVGSITQSIIDNPSLFDDLTPTIKGQVIADLQNNGYDTANLGVKGLSDSAMQSIVQSQSALSGLANLKEIITANPQYIGPVKGLAAMNPFSKARQIQADVNRVRQTVGKSLEGGVLRKEDEEKYKKILATLTDTPDTAEYKIDALISSIQSSLEEYKSLQQSGGKSLNVGASLTKKGTTSSPESLRSKYEY